MSNRLNGFLNSPANEAEKYSNHFDSQFLTMSFEDLVECFRPVKYNALGGEDPGERANARIALARALEGKIADNDRRPKVPVCSISDDPKYADLLGGFNSKDPNEFPNGKIEIRAAEGQNSFEALFCEYHESTHANDHYKIVNGYGYDDFTQLMVRAESPEEAYELADKEGFYRNGVDELRANNRAASFLIDCEDRFADEPEYREYVETTLNLFSQTNQRADHYSEDLKNVRLDQAEIAYKNHILDDDEYLRLQGYLNDPNFKDPNLAEAKMIEQELEELHARLQQQETESTAEEQSVPEIEQNKAEMNTNFSQENFDTSALVPDPEEEEAEALKEDPNELEVLSLDDNDLISLSDPVEENTASQEEPITQSPYSASELTEPSIGSPGAENTADELTESPEEETQNTSQGLMFDPEYPLNPLNRPSANVPDASDLTAPSSGSEEKSEEEENQHSNGITM